jgi:hypothetical protein
MQTMEILLEMNMAACKLKLKQWKEAIDHCKMALQIEKQNVKAVFRRVLPSFLVVFFPSPDASGRVSRCTGAVCFFLLLRP